MNDKLNKITGAFSSLPPTVSEATKKEDDLLRASREKRMKFRPILDVDHLVETGEMRELKTNDPNPSM